MPAMLRAQARATSGSTATVLQAGGVSPANASMSMAKRAYAVKKMYVPVHALSFGLLAESKPHVRIIWVLNAACNDERAQNAVPLLKVSSP